MPPAPTATPTLDSGPAARTQERAARWRRQLYQWHWISSALCLAGMLLFAITGITLNNAGRFESSQPQVQRLQATLPASLRATLAAPGADDAPLPAPVRAWLAQTWSVELPAAPAHWEGDAALVDLQSPGVDALLRVDRASGVAEYERSDRGWIAYLNDLHKGRHAGLAWSWFLDLFAVAALVFSLTGLLILQLHARARPFVWPVTALGLVLPVMAALLLVH